MKTIRGNQTAQQQLAKEFHLTLSQELALTRLPMSQRIAMQRIASDIARTKSVVGVDAKLIHISDVLSIDVMTVVQLVLRESYMESMENLGFYAKKVKFYNEQKKQIRDQVTSLREFQSRSVDQYRRTQDSSSDSDSIRRQMLRNKDQLTRAIRSTSSSSKKRPKK